jgi:hypothetical protein
MTRRLIAWAARLYPSAWRARYGEEFAATIGDMRESGWAAVWDVWKGAIAMQIEYGSRMISSAAIFAALGLVLASIVSMRIPDMYISESAVQAENMDPESLQLLIRRVLARPRLQALIEKHHLYRAERSSLPTEDLTDTMAKNISIAGVAGRDSGRRAFTVGFVDTDAASVQRVTAELVAALMQERVPASAVGGSAGVLAVINPASSPDPIYPNRLVIASIGLLGGALLGAASAVLKRRKA